METYIEKRFKEISRDTQNELLYNQWKIDKLQVVKILERIKDFFPHYTNHDSSHSEVILNNIYLLVGEDGVNKLSSTDLWLLLQVAYFHDIGMIIDKETIEKTFESLEFVDYIKKLKKDERHSLHKYSNIFDTNDNRLEFKNKELSNQTFFYPKYLVADFLRPKHGERINENVNTTFEKEFTHRDGSLVPKRLYELIYKISVIHTRDFSKVFTLVIKENGFSTDKCHPRLIACLLRLGDLLDLDSNRYDNFMDKLFYDIPLDSIDHITKHRSIDTLNIDNESITIVSKIKNEKDYTVYNFTKDWFDWIEEEVTNQKLKWHKMIPRNLEISIPLVDRIEILQEGYSLLPSGEVPHFSFSPEKALEVIKGSQIYSEKSNYFREIIQNAVDATYIKIWCESEKNNTTDKFPQDKLPADINDFKRFEISIDVQLDQEKTEIKNDGGNYYKITIQDKGIGLSVNDLKYLLNVTSSKDNIQREKIIEKMPTYLKPSGNFGIGFQSIFNMTDSVTIKSKSYFTNDEIELTLENPSKNNNVFFKSNMDTTNKNSYFELSFNYRVEKNVKRYSVDEHRDKDKYNLMKNYDLVRDDDFDLEIFDIYRWIKEVCSEILFIPIKLKFKNKEEFLSPDLKNKYLLFSGNFIVSFKENHKDISITCFRGQNLKFGFENWKIPSILDIDLIGYNASDILSYSRNQFKDVDIRKKILDDLYNDLQLFFKKDNIFIDKRIDVLEKFNTFILVDKFAKDISYYKEQILNFNLTSLLENIPDTSKNYFEEWIKPFREKEINSYRSLIEFSKRAESVKISRFSLIIDDTSFSFLFNDDKRDFSSSEDTIRNILVEQLLTTHKKIYPKDTGEKYEMILEITFSKNELASEEEKFYNKSLISIKEIARPPFNRYVWYAKEKYKDLVIKKDEFDNTWIYRPEYYYLSSDFIFMPVLLQDYEGYNGHSPRTHFIDNIDDDFINFIQPKLKKSVGKERIVELYKELIEELN